MSLYYEAAGLLASTTDSSPLASRIYGAKDLKSKPAHLYALSSEAFKWSPALSGVVEKAELLRLEKKLTPTLALLLTHDLLLSKNGVAAPKNHILRLAIERHRARLSAELIKARIRGGHATLDDWKAALEADDNELLPIEGSGSKGGFRHPRWIRVNTLRTNLVAELSSTFSGFQAASLSEVQRAAPTQKIFYQDIHIPSLLALPDRIDLAKSTAYKHGHLILQDKASCFPAYLLSPQPEDGDIIDACAAPGNKTTHLAALIRSTSSPPPDSAGRTRTVFACERDTARSLTLQKMTITVGADKDDLVEVLAKQDFLRLNPSDARFKHVGALLLDPSCSGSGIVGRDDGEDETLPKLVLPRTPAEIAEETAKTSRGKKRKRVEKTAAPNPTPPTLKDAAPAASDDVPVHKPLAERLTALSAFQLTLLKHAFAFPAARKVAYSTCSLYAEENEHVVLRALASEVARARGWRVQRREEQVEGMRAWGIRGDAEGVSLWLEEHGKEAVNAIEIGEACLRCEKGTVEGTMGFFAVLFVRDREADDMEVLPDAANGEDREASEQEWGGFSESEYEE